MIQEVNSGSYLTFMPPWAIKICRHLPTKLQIYENLTKENINVKIKNFKEDLVHIMQS